MKKSEKTKFNAMVKEVERLKKEVASQSSSKDMYYRERNDLQRELDSIHAALDTLPGIPSKTVKVGEYGATVTLTITARLFSWISHVAFGGKIINKEVK